MFSPERVKGIAALIMWHSRPRLWLWRKLSYISRPSRGRLGYIGTRDSRLATRDL